MNAVQSGNPFATRHIRAGALRYDFGEGMAAETLVERLAARSWRGAIVGPHGTGKSTLLRTLAPFCEARGRRPVVVRLAGGQRRLPKESSYNALSPGDLLMVDGFEQLPFWRRWRLDWQCRRRGVGLLVTCHRRLHLPLLFETRGDLAIVQALVCQLCANAAPLVDDRDVSACFAACDGNVRETLLMLYDRYELRVPSMAPRDL